MDKNPLPKAAEMKYYPTNQIQSEEAAKSAKPKIAELMMRYTLPLIVK